jgi:hypothetical protein
MNRDNIIKTIALIRANSDKFNMERYQYFCGTPACIAGWACTLDPANLLPNGELHHKLHGESIAYRAARILGLEYNWATDYLFNPDAHKHLREITVDEAIAALERLLMMPDGFYPEDVALFN